MPFYMAIFLVVLFKISDGQFIFKLLLFFDKDLARKVEEFRPEKLDLDPVLELATRTLTQMVNPC